MRFFLTLFAILLSFNGCITDDNVEIDQRDLHSLTRSLSEGASSAGTIDGQRAQPAAFPQQSFGEPSQFEAQPMCGNGDCTLRVDRFGREYCTCMGRRGRAKLECCEQ